MSEFFHEQRHDNRHITGLYCHSHLCRLSKQELDDEYAQQEKFMRNKYNSAISEANHLISLVKDDKKREHYSSISRRINTSLSEINTQADWINRKHERDNEKIS